MERWRIKGIHCIKVSVERTRKGVPDTISYIQGLESSFVCGRVFCIYPTHTCLHVSLYACQHCLALFCFTASILSLPSLPPSITPLHTFPPSLSPLPSPPLPHSPLPSFLPFLSSTLPASHTPSPSSYPHFSLPCLPPSPSLPLSLFPPLPPTLAPLPTSYSG